MGEARSRGLLAKRTETARSLESPSVYDEESESGREEGSVRLRRAPPPEPLPGTARWARVFLSVTGLDTIVGLVKANFSVGRLSLVASFALLESCSLSTSSTRTRVPAKLPLPEPWPEKDADLRR